MLSKQRKTQNLLAFQHTINKRGDARGSKVRCSPPYIAEYTMLASVPAVFIALLPLLASAAPSPQSDGSSAVGPSTSQCTSGTVQCCQSVTSVWTLFVAAYDMPLTHALYRSRKRIPKDLKLAEALLRCCKALKE